MHINYISTGSKHRHVTSVTLQRIANYDHSCGLTVNHLNNSI